MANGPSEPVGEQGHSYPVPFAVTLPFRPEDEAPAKLKVVRLQIIFCEIAECRSPRASRKDSSGVEWQVNFDPQINFVSLYIKGVQDVFNLK